MVGGFKLMFTAASYKKARYPKAIILPQADKKEAYMIAERIRMDIQKYPFLDEDIFPNKMLTVSLGISTFPEDGLLPAELIASSDNCLYQAKNKGKNNTCCS